jgi:hypothetical protein
MEFSFTVAAANIARRPYETIRSVSAKSLVATLGPQGTMQDANLAQQFSNPIATLTSVPLQDNFRRGYPKGGG